ncbi:MAG: MMPL family transporter [Proteobacteria bacterium]|nr:MMPL family transporter [Pseudomonadota bacterium]
MTLFSIISTAAICLFLYLMFRRISGVFIPLIIVYLSLIFTLCIMSITGAVIKIPFVIVPSFLLTVGVGDVVHILAYFYVDFNNSGNKKESIASAASHSIIAVIFTSTTTAGGLLSFITAEIAPVADLGVYAAAGVMVAFLFTFLLLPALIAIIPLKPKKNVETKNENTKMMDVIKKMSIFSINRPVSIILLGCLFLVASFFFMTKIRFFHNVVEWFPERDPIRMAT